MNYNNLLKFKLQKNSKIPLNKGWTNPANLSTDIDMKYGYNVGVATGRVNNLIVLDIDIKDEGEQEFNKYISQYGDIDTLKILTPSGGYHYYFKYATDNKDDQYLIDNCLLTKCKYRGKGIDIRSNGGYVVAPPSTINNIEYKLVSNTTDIINMPANLIHFLLESDTKPPEIIKEQKAKSNETINTTIQNDIKYIVDDKILFNMLNKLNSKYLNNFNDWTIITTCLKSCNKFFVWDEWCKKSLKYNYNNNVELWNKNKGSIDINYIVSILNNAGYTDIKMFDKYKIYTPITQTIKCKTKTFNNRYVLDKEENKNNFTYADFINNNTIIIESDTATGKTSGIIKHFMKYQDELKNKKFLSITSKISLAQQHIQSFHKETNNKYILASYDDKTINFDKNNYIVCCINSILKFQYLTDEEIKDMIIFIDEVSLFTQDLTHNDTLMKILKPVFVLLMRLIKLCHKVIVCQASINDNVFNLLKDRPEDSKIYIKNEYKNYKGIDAHIIKDENIYYESLKQKIKNNEPFFIGGDSKAEIDKYYHLLLNEALPEQKDKFILITSETKFKINNASEQFKDKFIFYSPSIIYGVDFNIDDVQDVFLLLKGNTISPSESFQQITRTRKIKNVYIYSASKEHEPRYNTINDVKEYYGEMASLNYKFNDMCICLDEQDKYKVVENSFYNMYVYNEYVADIMATNKLLHLKDILINRGFNIIEPEEQQIVLDNNIVEMAKELKEEYNTRMFDEYINILFNNEMDEIDKKYIKIIDNIATLKLPNDKDILIEYKDLIIDSNKIKEHYDILRILKHELYIKHKIVDIESASFKCKTYNSVYHKIALIRNIEQSFNIINYDVSHLNNKTSIQFDDSLYKLIKGAFRTSKSKPTTNIDLLKLYIGLVKSITHNEIITTEYKTKARKEKDFLLNNELLLYHLKLDKYQNKKALNYDKDILKHINYIFEEDYIYNSNITIFNDGDLFDIE